MVVLFLTFLWQVVLAVGFLAVSIMVLGWQFYTDKKLQEITHFIVSHDGVISFSHIEQHYQISAKTRVNTFALWIELIPINDTASTVLNLPNSQKALPHMKTFFLYRDSIARQDLSHLMIIISRLSS